MSASANTGTNASDSGRPGPRAAPSIEREASIAAGGGRTIHGTWALPRPGASTVVFAHGSGSGRSSPRNQFVARVLRDAGLGTLLIDLLTEDEAADRGKVFDIGLLAERLLAAASWTAAQPESVETNAGLAYFGASTGAAAALLAAARAPEGVFAVVSRGGRPDLARDALPFVGAPVLLIVGGADESVLKLNRAAYDQLTCPRRLDVVPGATHLFAEPGALEDVAERARDWILQHRPGPGPMPV